MCWIISKILLHSLPCILFDMVDTWFYWTILVLLWTISFSPTFPYQWGNFSLSAISCRWYSMTNHAEDVVAFLLLNLLSVSVVAQGISSKTFDAILFLILFRVVAYMEKGPTYILKSMPRVEFPCTDFPDSYRSTIYISGHIGRISMAWIPLTWLFTICFVLAVPIWFEDKILQYPRCKSILVKVRVGTSFVLNLISFV